LEITRLVVLALAGAAAGFVNVSAGGGSLLTIPALIFVGLPPTVANGTNRIAILAQNVVSSARFRKSGMFQPALALTLAVPAVAGSVVGSLVAVNMSDTVFQRLLAVVMLLVLAAILFGRSRNDTHDDREAPQRRSLLFPLFFLVGFYGGLIQAGVGFLSILLLHNLGGLTLVRTNSVKVIIIACFTLVAAVTFLIGGKIDWPHALVLTVGTTTGGWLGTVFNVSKGDKWVKVVLAVAVVAMSAKLAGVF
jgi:hypothetical protein